MRLQAEPHASCMRLQVENRGPHAARVRLRNGGSAMFFQYLGRVVRRGWWLLLAAWLVLVVVTRLLAPRWGEVTQDREFSFLPGDAPSRVAEQTFAEAFPNR